MRSKDSNGSGVAPKRAAAGGTWDTAQAIANLGNTVAKLEQAVLSQEQKMSDIDGRLRQLEHPA